MSHRTIQSLLIKLYILLTCGCYVYANQTDAQLEIDATTITRIADRHRLVGTNLSLWSRQHIIENPSFQKDIREWQPDTIRIPGGSWSNEYYWNGNGVRTNNGHGTENFDLTKRNADGSWNIDYSDYKKGFRVHGEERLLSHYHGDLDVKLQHEWIQALGSKAMVTVNVGSGTPKLASEWLKWSNYKNDFDVRYWEIGNELNGDWELGHRLKDGSSMTGEIYADFFLEFSKVMHAQDPTAKLGGPAWSDLELDFVEELIRDGGDALNFVSLHAYPVGVNTKKVADKFAAIDLMRSAVRKIHKWIELYQPDRKEHIEIGITEWNIKVNEDRDTVDLINGLWSAIWVGAMFEEGIDFANQWDLSTYVEAGGHGAFYVDEAEGITVPKSQYWALWMWANLMGNELVKTKMSGPKSLKCFVTRSQSGLQIMLVNTSENEEATISIKGAQAHRYAKLHTFSSAEYFWDPHARKPLWSQKPSTKLTSISDKLEVKLPKFSVNVVELPWTELSVEKSEISQEPISHKAAKKIKLDLLVPNRAATDRPIEAWLVAHDPENALPDLKNTDPVNLKIEGPAKIDTQKLILDNGAASFTIHPSGSGIVNLVAHSAVGSTSRQIELVALQQRAVINWTFDNPINEWQVKSTFNIGSESSVKPNEFVASVELNNDLPARDADQLFHFEPIPLQSMPLSTASGVVGQLRTSHNLRCADPSARVNVILQSNANHWIPIGSIPLSSMLGKWKKFAFSVSKTELIDAMAQLYAVRFQIQADTPITGEIYLDDLGFIFRTGL